MMYAFLTVYTINNSVIGNELSVVKYLNTPRCMNGVEDPKLEKNVAIGIIEHNGLILITQRNDEIPLWNLKWEFPGGGIELQETAEQAVRREIREETSLEVTSTEFLGLHSHVWVLENGSKKTVRLHVFYCQVRQPYVQLNEESIQSKWVFPHEVVEHDILAPNRSIMEHMYPWDAQNKKNSSVI